MFQQITPASASHQASTRLSSGEVRDFEEAVTLYIRGMEYEARDSERMNRENADMPGWHRCDPDLPRQSGDVAREALRIYRDMMSEAKKQCAARLAELGEEYEQFADALESGDYSGLAW